MIMCCAPRVCGATPDNQSQTVDHPSSSHTTNTLSRAMWAGLLVAALFPSGRAAGDDDKKEPFPFEVEAPREGWKWDKADERFNELLKQLAIKEGRLEAVERAISQKSRRKASQQSDARRQDANSRMMDRKGGGPLKWDEFYGSNAEKFFYHPVDPNTIYRTDTFLRQIGKAEDDKTGEDTPSRQSLPVHQRPPQWDYIYRANKTARDTALADASKEESEIEVLEQRRTALEKDQAILWCKLAFRAVQQKELNQKDFLTCALLPATGTPDNQSHVKAFAASVRFLQAGLAVVDKAGDDQALALGGISRVVKDARSVFVRDVRKLAAIKAASRNTDTTFGQFYELSRLLADKADTLTENYTGAIDSDRNKENIPKEDYRAMLQESVVEYAELLLLLDQLADTLQKEWAVEVDTQQTVEPLKLVWEAPSPLDSLGVMAEKDPLVKAAPKTKPVKKPMKMRPVTYSFRTPEEAEATWAFTDDKWRVENNVLRLSGWESGLESKQVYDGDLTIGVQCSGGQELIVKAYGEEFRVHAATIATLERKGDFLVFTHNKGPSQKVQLKPGQLNKPTTIFIGHKYEPFYLHAVTITGTLVDVPQAFLPVAP